MKIRTDFVTNSSSTSYCLLGVNVREEELKKLVMNTITFAYLVDELKDSYEQDKKYDKDLKFIDWYIDNYGFSELLDHTVNTIAKDVQVYTFEYERPCAGCDLPYTVSRYSNKTYNEVKEIVAEQITSMGIPTESKDLRQYDIIENN